jgi:hypothetical protein
MWVLVKPKYDDKQRIVTEHRGFEVHGTEHDIPMVDKKTHLATVQERGFVWHVFEVKP